MLFMLNLTNSFSTSIVCTGILRLYFPMSRTAADRKKAATTYKSEKRKQIESEGYRILGNSGDQWSDLLGSSMSARSFKLPNPMYYIP